MTTRLASSLVRTRVLALVVPAVVVAVALLQHVRATTLDQSSWSGAGFGMFATYESELTRFVRVSLGDGGTFDTVALPAELSRQAFEVTVVPTRQRAAALARNVRSTFQLPPTTRIRVEVWGISYRASRVTPQLLAVAEDSA